MQRLYLLITFVLLAPMVFFFTLSYFLFLSYKQNHTPPKSVAFAALPNTQNVMTSDVVGKDNRVESITEFFAKYKSPLQPYAQNVVDAADFYGIDSRLLPAIAMQESNLCKKAPLESYNCWGFGIYGNKVIKFQSYQEGIDIVTKTLAKEYKQKGLETPEQIMKVYTPPSDGSWARGVSHFMNQL